MILWLIAYFLIASLLVYVLPKSVSKSFRLFNRFVLEKELHEFVKKHKNWEYIVVHFKTDGDQMEDAKSLDVYTDQKRVAPLSNRNKVERELFWCLERPLRSNIKEAVLDNNVESYVFQDHGYKTMNARSGVKIAKHLSFLVGGHIDIYYADIGGSAGYFGVNTDGSLTYTSGDAGVRKVNFIVISSRKKWQEHKQQCKQNREKAKQKGYKSY